jgi:hypothetical protein
VILQSFCYGKILLLIDYDEGHNGIVTTRQPRTLHQRRVYIESLVEDGDQFTKNQLINLFRDCWYMMGHEADAVTSLMEEYDRAFEVEGSPCADLVDNIYGRLCGALEKIILSETATPVFPY